jgi:hypothetical protein
LLYFIFCDKVYNSIVMEKLPVNSEFMDKIDPLVGVEMRAPLVGDAVSVNVVPFDEADDMARIAMRPEGDNGIVFHRMDGQGLQAMVNVTPDGDDEQQVSPAFGTPVSELSLLREGGEWYFADTSQIHDTLAAQKFAAALLTNALRKQREASPGPVSLGSFAVKLMRTVMRTVFSAN